MTRTLGINNLVDQQQYLNRGGVYFINTPSKACAINIALNCLAVNRKSFEYKFLTLNNVTRQDIVDNAFNAEILNNISAHVFMDKGKHKFLTSLSDDYNFMYAARNNSLYVVLFNDEELLKLDDKNKENFIKDLYEQARDTDSAVLLISFGLDPIDANTHLLKLSNNLSGISYIDIIQNSYILNIKLWKGEDGAFTQGKYILSLEKDGFKALENTLDKSNSNDENVCYIADKSLILDKNLYQNIKYFDSNKELIQSLTTLTSATIIFCVKSRVEIIELAKEIFTLRQRFGEYLKIIVIEKIDGIRSNSEQFLIACGASFIFNSNSKNSYINAILPTLKNNIIKSSIPTSFEKLNQSYNLLDNEQKGILDVSSFIKRVKYIVTSNHQNIRNDGTIAILTPYQYLNAKMAISQFTPNRGGDYCTYTKDKVIAYFPSCRDGELSITLTHAFNTSPDDLFEKVISIYTYKEILTFLDELSTHGAINLDTVDENSIISQESEKDIKNEQISSLSYFCDTTPIKPVAISLDSLKG